MLQRQTYHECAMELEDVCHRFCDAHLDKGTLTPALRGLILAAMEIRRNEIVHILAVSFRSDQDAGLMPRQTETVGALRLNVTDADAAAFTADYHPPHGSLQGCKPLQLGSALSRAAQHDLSHDGFYADEQTHDLIVGGTEGGAAWIAVVSLFDLCRVIMALPDAAVWVSTNQPSNR